METRDFIESVAAGLRRMDVAPDYLLVLVDRYEKWQYDDDTLCGIPVIKSHVSVNSGYSGFDYPIIPCFKNLEENKIFMQVSNFQRGIEEAGLFATGN